MPKLETKLKLPNKFDGSQNEKYADCQYYDITETEELQKTLKRVRSRVRQTMVRIVKEQYNIPPCTMDALYTLDDQLNALGYELQKDDVDHFENTPSIEAYLAQMSQLGKLGELLKEPVNHSGDTLYDLMCGDRPEEAEEDLQLLQSSLFVDGTDLQADELTPYSKAYGPRRKGSTDIEKTAAEWIAECKQEPFVSFDVKRKRDFSVPARIIAARQLSEAERGKKGKLAAEITEQALLTRAAELENDEFFRRIMHKKSVVDEVNECLGNSRSHGGALEDIMKREIRKLGPGRLPNKPIYERYMPTVKERIEALQKMAKNGSNMMKLKCAAEIVVLREIGRAERGKASSLKRPVPVDQLGTLRARVTALVNDEKFREAVKRPEIAAALQSGHGGKMVELIDAQLDNAPASRMSDLAGEQPQRDADQPEPEADQPEPQGVNYESVSNQLKMCTFEAMVMMQAFGTKTQLGKGEQKNILEKGKYLLADYILLDGMSRDPKNPMKIDPERLKLNAGNQQSREEQIREGMQTQAFRDMTEDLGAGEMLDLIRVMANKPQQEFMETLVEKGIVPEGIRKDVPDTPKKELTQPIAKAL